MELGFTDCESEQSQRDLWLYERQVKAQGYQRIAGLDEAGRGPLAGPVVAAAVVLPEDFDPEGVADSKALTPENRDEVYRRIICQAEAVGVGIVGPREIDEINILRATHKAMSAALEELDSAYRRALGVAFDFILLDGLPVPGLPKPSLAIVKGDAKCLSIMAASIVAKVTRDRIMCELDREYPEYGFARHKGYCTKQHLEALHRYGPSPIHRRSFAPVAERLAQCRLPGLD